MAGILGSLTKSSFPTNQSNQQVESVPQDQLVDLLGSLFGAQLHRNKVNKQPEQDRRIC